MLISTGQSWFIGYMSLQLLLLSFIAATSSSVKRLRDSIDDEFPPLQLLAPTCAAHAQWNVDRIHKDAEFRQRQLDQKLFEEWLNDERWKNEPLADCEAVCAERAADLVYSIAWSLADPCIHVMDTQDSASWDIFFRHPVEPREESDGSSHVCLCKIGMALQRVITRHPLQSDDASTSASTSSPSAPVFDNEYCELWKMPVRIIDSEKVLQRQAWYPKPSYVGDRTTHTLQDRGWQKSKSFNSRVKCNAKFQPFLAYRNGAIKPDGLLLPHSSNCTIKFHGGNGSQSNYAMLCCKGDHMALIIERINLLHSTNPRSDYFKHISNTYQDLCTQFGIPDSIANLIAEKTGSDILLGWQWSQMKFM
ncbi:hypothetical protein BCR37DRAFT_388484 [Protomyces lactucae-debilis]|uniref:Uncharacterized protein n=1 Tax=Protomyces lactucae-debilis TaxID=2754530 RepID=A0A1Y2F6J1_PROLT|nr:uncharacterized protein BCR37DRAFT_388484 [Protomyces lactucae-debilis]ORY79469.1 hypothetical protein BCR37DRAFT_388484 [Protomyces lactucae-debilis]